MYCRHCGQKISENAKFCGKCGEKVDVVRTDEPSPVTEEPGDIQQPADTQEPDNDKTPRKGKLWWKIVLIIVICAAAVVVCLFGWYEMRERQYRNHLDVAQTYINEKDYDEAIEELRAAIDIDPQVVEPYIQLADAYKELGNTEMVEGTIDAGRRMIVDTYERKGELPEDTETLYVNAVVDAVGNDDNNRAEKIGKEYVGMVDEQDADDFKEKIEEELNPDDEDVVDLSEESIVEMLEPFEYWVHGVLFDWYSTEEAFHNEESIAYMESFETIGPVQAYELAGISAYFSGWEDSESEQSNISSMRKRLPTSVYDHQLRNSFGAEYTTTDFDQYSDEVNDGIVSRDQDGQFYLNRNLGDTESIVMDISIEYISDVPDEDGNVVALVKYDSYNDSSSNELLDTYYMQYRLKPDEDSKYGCVIVGMVPAGDGEIDPEFLPESSTENTADVDWQQIYADYIENWEEADEDRTYEAMFINDDDIPELFVGGYGGFDAMGAVLFYIHDGKVEEYRGHALIWYPSFIEREGYIYSLRGQMGGVNERLAYLDEDGEMTILFDGEFYQPDQDNPSEDDYFEINGERVTQAAYEEEASKIASWMENDTGEWDGSGITFATGASEAVQKLRSGEAASIIGQ